MKALRKAGTATLALAVATAVPPLSRLSGRRDVAS
jgi:hypothetical protein